MFFHLDGFYLSPFEEDTYVQLTKGDFIFMIKVGDKIKIIFMDGEPSYSGKIGIVEHIDDIGQIHGSWGGCALIPGVDQFEVVEE